MQYSDTPRPDVQPFIPVGARRLLDVGCGQGAFGRALKQSRPGLVVAGVEPSVEAAAKAAERLDEVVVGHFPVVQLSGTFDCVTFNDVLEHMADPGAVLEATREVLAPGGTVVASLPNVRELTLLTALVFRGEWRYVDAGTLDRTHLRFFTTRSARRLFSEAGYVVERMAYMNPVMTRTGRVLGRCGRRLDDILHLQFVVVASPG